MIWCNLFLTIHIFLKVSSRKKSNFLDFSFSDISLIDFYLWGRLKTLVYAYSISYVIIIFEFANPRKRTEVLLLKSLWTVFITLRELMLIHSQLCWIMRSQI